jgi:Arc/MetJ-type ribon-helix-helix transcriptional regulator
MAANYAKIAFCSFMPVRKLTLSLKHNRLLDEAVESGQYESASDVVSAALDDFELLQRAGGTHLLLSLMVDLLKENRRLHKDLVGASSFAALARKVQAGVNAASRKGPDQLVDDVAPRCTPHSKAS